MEKWERVCRHDSDRRSFVNNRGCAVSPDRFAAQCSNAYPYAGFRRADPHRPVAPVDPLGAFAIGFDLTWPSLLRLPKWAIFLPAKHGRIRLAGSLLRCSVSVTNTTPSMICVPTWGRPWRPVGLKGTPSPVPGMPGDSASPTDCGWTIPSQKFERTCMRSGSSGTTLKSESPSRLNLLREEHAVEFAA